MRDIKKRGRAAYEATPAAAGAGAPAARGRFDGDSDSDSEFNTAAAKRPAHAASDSDSDHRAAPRAPKVIFKKLVLAKSVSARASSASTDTLSTPAKTLGVARAADSTSSEAPLSTMAASADAMPLSATPPSVVPSVAAAAAQSVVPSVAAAAAQSSAERKPAATHAALAMEAAAGSSYTGLARAGAGAFSGMPRANAFNLLVLKPIKAAGSEKGESAEAEAEVRAPLTKTTHCGDLRNYFKRITGDEEAALTEDSERDLGLDLNLLEQMQVGHEARKRFLELRRRNDLPFFETRPRPPTPAFRANAILGVAASAPAPSILRPSTFTLAR